MNKKIFDNAKALGGGLEKESEAQRSKYDPIVRWEQLSINLAMPSLGPHLKKKIIHYGSMVKNVKLYDNRVTFDVESKFRASISHEIGAFVNGYIVGRQEK